MFDLPENADEDSVLEQPLKKKKLNELFDSKPIHSSLDYSSLKAPPLVDYKSIDVYCENNLGKSLLPSFDKKNYSSSISDLNNLLTISSPIVFKSPKPPKVKRMLPFNANKHYNFFSVEELSLVKCIKRWTNTEVCAVGHTIFDSLTQQCYLQSAMEKGNWQLLLDTSLLPEIPQLQVLQQVYGTLEVLSDIPRLKVNFYRNLGSVDLPLFIESYRLMQKYVPEFVNLPESEKLVDVDSLETTARREGMDLNDTLDDYNFSVIM